MTTTAVVIPPFATARDLNARLPITKPIKLFVTKSLSASWGYVFSLHHHDSFFVCAAHVNHPSYFLFPFFLDTFYRSAPDRYASLTAFNRVNASRDPAIRRLKPVSSAANYPATINLVCKVSFLLRSLCITLVLTVANKVRTWLHAQCNKLFSLLLLCCFSPSTDKRIGKFWYN